MCADELIYFGSEMYFIGLKVLRRIVAHRSVGEVVVTANLSLSGR